MSTKFQQYIVPLLWRDITKGKLRVPLLDMSLPMLSPVSASKQASHCERGERMPSRPVTAVHNENILLCYAIQYTPLHSIPFHVMNSRHFPSSSSSVLPSKEYDESYLCSPSVIVSACCLRNVSGTCFLSFPSHA